LKSAWVEEAAVAGIGYTSNCFVGFYLAPVASIHAGKGGLAGMVLEPCGKPGTIVTGE
jgi:hypothetical protein